MNDHISELDNLNHVMENQGMKLPDKVLAFKLPSEAPVSESQRPV